MDHQHMSHDWPLVALSFVAALLASYTALDMGSRLRRAVGRARWLWLSASALVLGGGIWSMHFIAMLAMDVGMPVGYDFDLTALSFVIAVVIVALGFHLVTRPNPSRARQAIAGSVVGLGVAAMHYTGMSALILDGEIHYNGAGVALSIAIAVVAATAALWLTLNLTRSWQRAAAALVMAFAVCGMHYTAMAATSIEMSDVMSGAVDSGSRILLAGAVAMGLFVILCLSIVCVFADRRFEYLAEREAANLRVANKALTESRAAILTLFDNADQGFLTVGRDLVVGPQFSAACETIFGQSPAGKRIMDLLCPKDVERGEVLAATLASALGDEDEFARELKISLLPREFKLDGKHIEAEYKLLAEPCAVMLILTDVTEKTVLSLEVERERKLLELVVLAFTESEALAALVGDYRRFIQSELRELIARIDQEGAAGELHRRLHTFKGLLAQFSFPLSPLAIHEVETRLAENPCLSPASASETLRLGELADAFQQDVASVSELLGPGFDVAEGRVMVPQAQIRTMEQLARATLAGDPTHAGSAPLRLLQQALAALGRLNVKSALALHSRGAPTLAARLGKKLEPVIVEGDDAMLEPERYGEFIRSLVHVFRNAIDHGIETPEARMRAGKQPAGLIRCVVRERPGALEVLVADDGAGIDRAALAERLLASGESRSSVDGMCLAELVFREGLSSRDSASEISGRGVGLAATKAELDRLGGKVAIETKAGLGTAFTFTLPFDNKTDDHSGKAMRMAV
jgi:two-component system chemotaxis sensor kinase CheA